MRRMNQYLLDSLKFVGAASTVTLVLAGCRGQTSDKPPVHLQQNMYFQDSLKTQEESDFFKDGRASRPLEPGVVARGNLRENDQIFTGKLGDEFVEKFPVPLSAQMLKHGQSRFNIYCAPCHGGTGKGDGIVVKKGFIPPPDFASERVREMPVGYVYSVITNGVRTMPSYKAQIPVEDRWAIVSYLRALGLSKNAKLDQVPADVATSKGWAK